VIFSSPLPPVEIPTSALTPFVLGQATQHAAKPAFIDGSTGATLTYAELEAAVRTQAGGWLDAGLQPGEVVAIMAPNCPEYAITFHAVALAGGVVTTINPTYTEHEVAHQLRDAGATRLVAASMFAATASSATKDTAVAEIYLIGEAGAGSAEHRPVASIAGAPLGEQVGGAPDDMVVLPYSSGTTGLSKGVMLTHRNLVANIVQAVGPLDFSSRDAYVSVLPFFHIYGMQVLMNAGLSVGATLVTMPRFDLAQFLQLHQDHQLTRAFVAPPMVVALAKHPMVDDFDLSALRTIFSGAAPLSAELAAECAARLDCEVIQGYGMTELSPVSHVTPPGQFKPGSVGVTVPLTEIMVVDPATGEPGGVGDTGELWVRGPQVMRGYLNNPAATAATIDPDGWLHTGDVAKVDADGHVFIVDRLKELIKYKGFQVPPAELEALLLTHPDIADAAVIGVPDEEAGEIPAGFVVLKEGRDPSIADVQAFVAERVAHYKQIRQMSFVDAIPKSPSGKILRRVLRDQIAASG
jgi:4-coumarate--CoA ligase